MGQDAQHIIFELPSELIHILTPTGITLCGLTAPDFAVGIHTITDETTTPPTCAECLLVWVWVRA